MKYSAKTLTPVQVGQVVKALVLLGARKIIVEEVEKDRFVVTTTTEAAHSKKPNCIIAGKGTVFNMPKLNFYDTDAVKAFTLDVLVDNAELRRDLDFERRQSVAGWESAREQRTRAEKAEAAIAAAVSTLTNLSEARQAGVEVGWRDVDRAVADVLDLLKGGETK